MQLTNYQHQLSFYPNSYALLQLERLKMIAVSSRWNGCYRVFHTRDQNHVTAVGTPYWRSSFATATVAAVDVLSKLAANLV